MTLTKQERSKISKNNMAKSTAFQRKIAKIFQTFCEKKGLKTKFYSVPRSGGLRWTSRPDTIGDVVTPENFRFTIECKKHNNINLFPLFEKRGPNKSDDIIAWWNQACNDADRADRLPMLVFEKLRGKPIIVVPTINLVLFDFSESCLFTIIGKDILEKGWNYVLLMPLSDFLDKIELESLFNEK